MSCAAEVAALCGEKLSREMHLCAKCKVQREITVGEAEQREADGRCSCLLHHTAAAVEMQLTLQLQLSSLHTSSSPSFAVQIN